MSVTLKNRRLGASNSKWNVFLDYLVDDAGNEVPDYIVLSPLEPKPGKLTGVAVLPILDGRLLLIRSYRHPLECEVWEVSRGFIDSGETPAQAALRELQEETGLSCAPEDLAALGHYAPEPATMAGRGALFIATKCTGTPRQADDELGIGGLHSFTRDEAQALLDTGQIEDASTIILLLRYLARAA